MYCRKCGNQIDNRASVCPECGTPTGGGKYAKGTPKKKKHPVLVTVLVVIVVALVFAGFSGGDSQDDVPQKVASGNTVAPQPEQTTPVEQAETVAQTVPTTAAPTQAADFTVGDSVLLDGVTVTLKSVTESSGGNHMAPADGNVFVLCDFEIENGSDSEINVSSMLSFEAYVDDYSASSSLSATLSSSRPQLDGSVAAGKKMSGVVGYEVPQNWQTLEIRYIPNVWLDNSIIFTYSK